MYYNDIESTLECDTHADTFCKGRHTLILNYHDIPGTVYGCEPVLGSQNFHTVYTFMIYTYTMTGSAYHLVIHQEINIPHLDHHLLCPIQCRVNGVMINDSQNFLTNDLTPQTHDIVINIEDSDVESENLIFTLSLKGVTSYMPVNNPNK